MTPVHDRAYLLSASKRDDVLALAEVERYGRDSFGDADYVSIYGLKPAEWYARGIRLLARTAVECTRDLLADAVGRDIASLAGTARAVSGSVVVDPFAGSANTLFWIKRHVAAREAIGFELDAGVFATTRKNLSLAGLDITLVHRGYETGLKELSIAEDPLLIAFVAPPWGDALSAVSGLNLSRTRPPVPAIVDLMADSFPSHKVVIAIQVHETLVESSLADVTHRLAWSTLKTYDLDAPGQNHGVLLGTLGWTP